MTRPIIGITSNQMSVPDDVYQAFEVNYSPVGYTDAVKAAGGTPLIIPMTDDECAEHYIELVDALILTGGQDVSPTLYHEEPHVLIGKISTERDTSELALLKAAIKLGKPVFGVCRGLQLINVALGGTLYQDLEAQTTITVQHRQQSLANVPTHSIRVVEDSQLAQYVPDQTVVNSIHHQGVKAIGNGLRVSAYSADGVVEAIESVDNTQILAVQWHPEQLWQQSDSDFNLFKALVEKASYQK